MHVDLVVGLFLFKISIVFVFNIDLFVSFYILSFFVFETIFFLSLDNFCNVTMAKL